MRESASAPFRWLPRRGCNPAALRRLRENFPRPATPLEPAWFLAGAPPRDEIGDGWMSYWELRDALYDVACNAPQPGARDWFHFLLAQETPGAMFGSVLPPLVEALATGLFVFHPHGSDREPYDGFIRDCLDTLGSAIMGPDGWSFLGRINRGAILRRRWRLGAGWEWGGPAGDLSASMFLCLKYLPQVEIDPWLRSALDIRDPFWRGQLLAWFLGARAMLDESDAAPDKGEPPLCWSNSNLLAGAGPLLPQAHGRAALDAVAAYFEDHTFSDWLQIIMEEEALAADLGRTPWRFQERFLRAPA